MSRRLLALALVMLGCNSQGKVGLRFVLDGALVEQLESRWLHVRVTDGAGQVLGGDVVEGTTESLSLSIRHGEGRVAVLEVRNGPDPATAVVLGYGLSPPFSIQPGDQNTVEVPVTIGEVAQITALSINEDQGGFVRSPSVTLTIRTTREDVANVIIAQDAGLGFGRVERSVEGGAELSLSYDLNEGCAALGICQDGLRSLFVRVEDQFGYPSAATVVSVNLDSRSPGVFAGTVGVQIEREGALVELSEATDGSVVRLSFSLDEPVTSTPSVSLEDTGLPFTFEARSGDAWSFTRQIGPEDSEGPQRPQVSAPDRAGNVAPVSLGVEYIVDRTPPRPPDVQTEGRIVYLRAPWGVEDSTAPSFQLLGQPGAVEPGAWVQVYDSPHILEDGEVIALLAGSIQADESGGFRMNLTPVDRSSLYLLSVDIAGNPQGELGVRVRDIEWTVPATSPAGTAPPTEVYAADRLPTSLRRDREGISLLSDAQSLREADGLGPQTEYVLRWDRLIPFGSPAPTERRYAGVVYDLGLDRVSMFEGRISRDLTENETWSFDGRSWSQRPPNEPPRCDDGSGIPDDFFGYLSYVGALGKTVLVCRRLSPNQLPPLPKDTLDTMIAYGWNGERWSDLELIAEKSRPRGRVGQAMAYDARRGALVMFGGNTGSLQVPGPDQGDFRVTLDETWELKPVFSSTVGIAGRLSWTQHDHQSAPPPRDRAAMVYDPVREVIVLFGGISRERQALDDMWTFDGTQWQQIPRTEPWPDARAAHAMVFDPISGSVGVLGGVTEEPFARQLRFQDSGLSDAWWWDGATWTRTPTAAATPSGPGLAAVSRPQASPLVMSGTPLGEFAPPLEAAKTWEVGPQAWSDRTPTDQVPPQTIDAITFDSTHRNLVAFFSSGEMLTDRTEETWTWSNSGWRQRVAPNSHPPIGDGFGDGFPSSMAYDPELRAVFLSATNVILGLSPEGRVETFGTPYSLYRLNETGTWQQVQWSPGMGPAEVPFNSFRLLTYSPALSESVVLTGTVSNNLSLWSYNGARWNLLDSGYSSPSSSFQTNTLVGLDDPSSILHFAWSSGASEYDGQWFESPLAPSIDIVHDPGRNLLISVDNNPPDFMLWERHNDQWVSRPTIGPLPPIITLSSVRLQYDPFEKRLLTARAATVGSTPGQINSLDVDPANRPAVIVEVTLSAANIAPADVRSMVATVVAGGEGGEDEATIDGYELLVYNTQTSAWLPIGDLDAPLDTPARLEAEVDGSLGQQLLVSNAEETTRVILAIVPKGSLARRLESPKVMADQLLLKVRYRLP